MNTYQKSRGIAVCLAIFLGGFGIHKFYLDRPGQGILYLLFCWTFVPAFIALFEGIMWALTNDQRWHEIYEGSYHVNRGEDDGHL